MKGRAKFVVVLLIIVCGSCSSTSGNNLTFKGGDLSTAGGQSLSQVCTRRGALELVELFLVAYNDGSSESSLTEEFFAPTDRFQWFFDSAYRYGDVASDRMSLEAYFEQQHAIGDELSIVDFSFNGYRKEDDTGHFGMTLSRNGVDLPSKGAIDCASAKIMVWSVGGPAPDLP